MIVPNKVKQQPKGRNDAPAMSSKSSTNDNDIDDVLAALLTAEKGIIKNPTKTRVAPQDNPNKKKIPPQIKETPSQSASSVHVSKVQEINPIYHPSSIVPPPPPPPLPVSSTVLIRDAEMAQHVMQKRALESRIVTKSTIKRIAGGEIWQDPTMADWDKNDYRLFVGNLGYEASDDLLVKTFSHYPSFKKARVVRDKKTGRCKGFGFISFGNAEDYLKATKEFNGKYVGSRPIKLARSKWEKRQFTEVSKEEKKKRKLEKILKS